MKDYIKERCSVDSKGCWIWTLSIESRTGYGKGWNEGKSESAHRISYKAFKGEIPDGLHIDHLCRVRECVNPDHLEAVTLKENVLRGVGITAENARKKHCKHGHPFTGYNVIRRESGRRTCRTCNVALTRKWRAKLKGTGVEVGAI